MVRTSPVVACVTVAFDSSIRMITGVLAWILPSPR